jgi:hypothetical protein
MVDSPQQCVVDEEHIHITNRRWIPFSLTGTVWFALLGGWIGWFGHRTYEAMIKGRIPAELYDNVGRQSELA